MTARRTCVALIAGAVLSCCVPSGRAQAPALRVQVDAVTIDAYAHQDGRPIPALTASDFIVRDNGVEQVVTALATTDGAHVIVALDVSGSLAGEAHTRLRSALERILTLLTPADRLSVITFGDRVRVHTVAAEPGTVPTDAVWSSGALGSTTLNDAIVVAAQLGDADVRPAMLLLFTDGTDTASWSTAAEVLETLRRSKVVVVAVGAGLRDAAPTPADSTFFKAAAWLSASPGDTLRFMQSLADLSGGEFVRVERSPALGDVFATVLQRHRQRYLLSFTPASGSARGWHRLEVRLRTRSGTVVARQGYMVP
ncbi:MAG TPA: VWA domain-containing protein [Luteitalea sp.]|nr:VWA domain-containing protein [Luteitalea sp.]